MVNIIIRGGEIAKGKTKVLYEVEGDPTALIVENMDAITKNDDPSATREMSSKAKHATATTCAVFQLLKEAELPVAFHRQLSEREFLVPNCKMIPLEVVVRRYAVGSYLNRNPQLATPSGSPPYRFDRLEFELFLKTTGGRITSFCGEKIGQTPIDPKNDRHIDDPLILDPYVRSWRPVHPKLPSYADGWSLGFYIDREAILSTGVTVEQIEEIARDVFLVLEGAWAQLDCRLIDFKLEFGLGPNGELLVADVIDNDSWRVRDREWKELSKQLFRDCHDLSEVEEKYALVARLVQGFSIDQAMSLALSE